MKKIIKALRLGFVFLSGTANLSALYDVFLDQEEVKKNSFFSNGASIQDLEDTLRAQIPDMPKILVMEWGNKKVDFPAYAHGLTPVAITSKDGALRSPMGNLLLCPRSIININYDTAQYALLHEIGHSSLPYMEPALQVSTLGVFGVVTYAWKKLLSPTPYRNVATKLGSKCFAGYVVCNLYKTVSNNLEERRADNFANKHALTISTLKAGRDMFCDHQKWQHDTWSAYKLSKVVPFCLGQYYLDKDHPSVHSRISKIEAEIDRRNSLALKS